MKLPLSLNPASGTDIAEQIRQQLLWLITSEQLKAGDALPSVRLLARQLSVNLHTIRSAYHKLAEDGFIQVRQGKQATVLPHEQRRLGRIAGGHVSHTIGVIVPNMSNPFYQELIQGVDEVARRDQTMIFMCNCYDDPIEARRYLAQLSAKQVDGVIVASHNVMDRRQPKPELPMVSVDWPSAQGYSVNTDLELAGALATRHLIEHKHRRIGLITFEQDVDNVRPANRGYEAALLEAGLKFDPALIARVGGFGMQAGAEGLRMLLGFKRPPTAVFAIADTLALGVLRAARAAGLRIPQDLALVSCNDIPTADLVEPPLTTVSVPVRDMGREAMRMLHALIAGEKPGKRKAILPPILAVRQSCGCLPARRKEGSDDP